MTVDYSKLTDRSRATVKKAFDMAKELNHPEILPQVMMAALMEEGHDMVSFLLQQMGVDRVAFAGAVGASVPDAGAVPVAEVPMSGDLVAVLGCAIELAVRSGSAVAALEHVFWAFASVPGPVKTMMRSFGIAERDVEEAVARFHGGGTVQETQGNRDEGPAALRKYARDLTRLAEEGRLEPVIGRDDETRRVLQILARKTKNNPVLVGEPGTGKTAVVEGLAHRLVRRDVPRDLLGLRLYALDMSALVAGASHHGEFEDRLRQVVQAVKDTPGAVLFIDEIHLLVGAGRGGGAMDAANILKPELARGEFRVIGATTIDEYVKYVESDKAFERRFQKVTVDEPDEDTAITIMRGIKQRFETFHRIKILDEAIVSAVRLSRRYISGRFLPDKAIDLLDEAASRMRMERSSVPVELDELSRLIRSKEMERESLRQDEQDHDLAELDVEIDNLHEKENVLNARWENERRLFEEVQQLRDTLQGLRAEREDAERSGRYEEAVTLRCRIEETAGRIAALSESSEATLLKAALDDDDIRQVVTAWTGIPVQRLKEDEADKLLGLEGILSSSVIGQGEAVAAVSKVIRRNKVGFGDSGRPIGSFLFLGTTGVGKTELARTLAEYLFNSRDMMVRIDMSEYQQEFAVSRLFGAPPGYVGYDRGGQLTEAVRRKPYSVVLLDEIEKAHPKVFETLLQVLEDGRMTDGQGRTVNFKNTIVIMTSNLKMEELKTRLAPEFINRIDDIIRFNPLGKDEIRSICRLQLESLRRKMAKSGIEIRFDESAVDLLAECSYQPEYGARPVKRAVNEQIVDALSLMVLDKEIRTDELIVVSASDGRFEFENPSSPE